MKIVLSALAKFELKDIVAYIKRDSVRYANLEKQRILTSIDKLYSHPELGRIFKKLNDENIRELISKNYSIIYEISADKKRIEIITIHHHARSLEKNPAFNEDD